MKSYRKELHFSTKTRRAYVNITPWHIKNCWSILAKSTIKILALYNPSGKNRALLYIGRTGQVLC